MTRFAQIAQSVEQRIENPRVGGSIPSLGTMKIQGLTVFTVGPFSLFFAKRDLYIVSASEFPASSFAGTIIPVKRIIDFCT